MYYSNVLQRACQIGLSYLPLAEAVFVALERWKPCIIKNKTFLEDVMPCLEPYLHSQSGKLFKYREGFNQDP